MFPLDYRVESGVFISVTEESTKMSKPKDVVQGTLDLLILKILALGLASILLLLGLLVGGALGYRAHRQHQNSEALAIRTPNGIDRSM